MTIVETLRKKVKLSINLASLSLLFFVLAMKAGLGVGTPRRGSREYRSGEAKSPKSRILPLWHDR